ncbi:MAG: cyclic-di-AMP receptor [Solobacterium sp.]|nr:cyclic-di-AMP receptor [Solobacterium sp.]
MKLVMATVSNDDANDVTAALNENGYYVTTLATTGGFLKAGNTTMIVGTEDGLVEHCIEVIGSVSSRRVEAITAGDQGRYIENPVRVTVGGATIFVLDVEQFRKL